MTNEPSEGLRDRVAKTIFEAQRGMLFKAVEELSFDCDGVRRFVASLSGESDRALAIVVAAYIDDKLRHWLAASLNPQVVDGLDSLFQAFGPLDSFSSRIRMASALHWISAPTQNSLEAIRRIRNEFAHRPFIGGFEDPKIAAALASMPDGGRAISEIFEDHRRLPGPLNLRETFHLRAGITLLHTISEVATAPLATRQALHPFTAAHAPHDDVPHSLRALTLAVVDGLLEAFGAADTTAPSDRNGGDRTDA